MTRDAINYLETQPTSVLSEQSKVTLALKDAGFNAEAKEVANMKPKAFIVFAMQTKYAPATVQCVGG